MSTASSIYKRGAPTWSHLKSPQGSPAHYLFSDSLPCELTFWLLVLGCGYQTPSTKPGFKSRSRPERQTLCTSHALLHPPYRLTSSNSDINHKYKSQFSTRPFQLSQKLQVIPRAVTSFRATQREIAFSAQTSDCAASCRYSKSSPRSTRAETRITMISQLHYTSTVLPPLGSLSDAYLPPSSSPPGESEFQKVPDFSPVSAFSLVFYPTCCAQGNQMPFALLSASKRPWYCEIRPMRCSMPCLDTDLV